MPKKFETYGASLINYKVKEKKLFFYQQLACNQLLIRTKRKQNSHIHSYMLAHTHTHTHHQTMLCAQCTWMLLHLRKYNETDKDFPWFLLRRSSGLLMYNLKGLCQKEKKIIRAHFPFFVDVVVIKKSIFIKHMSIIIKSFCKKILFKWD